MDRIHLMEFCSLQGRAISWWGTKPGGGFLQVVCAWGEASSAGTWLCGCSPTPGFSVSGQVGEVAADHRMPRAGCSVGLQRHSRSGGGQKGQRSCPLGKSSLERLIHLCQGFWMYNLQKKKTCCSKPFSYQMRFRWI